MARPPLTIGTACFDDFDGVYFTLTSLLLHHADVMNQCEIVVVDNCPHSEQGRITGDWIRSSVPRIRYVPFVAAGGTAQARNEVFRQARGKAVLCLDCHVLLAPGAVRKLIEFYGAHRGCRDLLTGPLLRDSGAVGATHQRPTWGAGAWGQWALDERGRDPDGEPFEVWQQGMGLFSCRRKAWVGFHPQFRGFGGCETYVMEKFRRRGGRVLCCPWLRWTHRFRRISGAPYPARQQDKLRNYLIGFQELGLDTQPLLEHFQVSAAQAQALLPSVPDAAALAVIGSRQFVGVNMRGRVLAERLGCKLLRPNHVAAMQPRETIVAIKERLPWRLVRAKCERLIYDPLDAFSNTYGDEEPRRFWRKRYDEVQFDDILATSPACAQVMREALPDRVRVHVVPHQCDARIHPGWRDPDGPVAYAGLSIFVRSGLERMRKACQRIGRELVVGNGCEVLQGASLALALRLAPFNTPLYRCCKPQIKLENAAAAGLPAVATDCPASTSLHPDVVTIPTDFSVNELAAAMQRALDGPDLGTPYTNGDYLRSMSTVLRCPSRVVYTGIFGGYDELREPSVREDGIQYVCFTDNPRLRSRGWEIRYCQPSGDPVFQAKRIKVLAHETFQCSTSLWVDGHVELRDLNGIFDRFDAELGLQQHPLRNCIYEEADYCKQVGRGDPQRIDQTIARFRAAGHPERTGLWRGGIVLRRHTPATQAFNREWWRQVNLGTSRDQLILPVLLRNMNIRFATLPKNTPRHHVGKHLERI